MQWPNDGGKALSHRIFSLNSFTSLSSGFMLLWKFCRSSCSLLTLRSPTDFSSQAKLVFFVSSVLLFISPGPCTIDQITGNTVLSYTCMGSMPTVHDVAQILREGLGHELLSLQVVASVLVDATGEHHDRLCAV